MGVAVGLIGSVLAAAHGSAGADPAATLEVSSSAVTDDLGLTFTEGVLRYRGRIYTVTLRGVDAGAEAIGLVAHLDEVHEIEGTYAPDSNILRNEHGVTLTFEPPLALQQGRLQLSLRARVYPKSANGLKGRFD